MNDTTDKILKEVYYTVKSLNSCVTSFEETICAAQLMTTLHDDAILVVSGINFVATTTPSGATRGVGRYAA